MRVLLIVRVLVSVVLIGGELFSWRLEFCGVEFGVIGYLRRVLIRLIF